MVNRFSTDLFFNFKLTRIRVHNQFVPGDSLWYSSSYTLVGPAFIVVTLVPNTKIPDMLLFNDWQGVEALAKVNRSNFGEAIKTETDTDHTRLIHFSTKFFSSFNQTPTKAQYWGRT